MRARRDALARDISGQQASLADLQGEVADLQTQLACASEAKARLQESAQLEATKSILVTAFLNAQRQQEAVWQEYRARLREKAKLDLLAATTPPTANHHHQQQQYFTDDAGQALTATQRNLRTALRSLQQAFEATFQLALDRQQQQQPPSLRSDEPTDLYTKVTVEEIASHPDLRALFSMDRSGHGDTADAEADREGAFRSATFLQDLNREVQRSIEEVERRIKEAEAERNSDTRPSASNATAGEAPPKPSIRDVFSSLISSLQAESTTRFMQAQQLANESLGGEEILEELIRKQREGDDAVLDAPGDQVSLETKHTLLAVRKLQHLQRHLAALKAQMAFAHKTYATFAGIRDARQAAMDAFVRQKDQVTSFGAARRRNEAALVALVGENKIMRRKIQGYAQRVGACVAGELAPMCMRVERAALALVDSVAREAHAGLECLVSPMSLLEKGTDEQERDARDGGGGGGGKGRVPVSRLMLHQSQQASSQATQLHALLMMPTPRAAQVEHRLVRHPSALVWTMQEMATEGQRETTRRTLGLRAAAAAAVVLLILLRLLLFLLACYPLAAVHLALLQRAAVVSRQNLLQSASSAPGATSDLTSSTAWSHLLARVRSFDARLSGEWTTALRAVLHRATETRDQGLPRVSTLVESFWRQPAAATIGHLRNRLGYNVDDYVAQMRTLLAQVQQAEARYNRALKNKLEQRI